MSSLLGLPMMDEPKALDWKWMTWHHQPTAANLAVAADRSLVDRVGDCSTLSDLSIMGGRACGNSGTGLSLVELVGSLNLARLVLHTPKANGKCILKPWRFWTRRACCGGTKAGKLEYITEGEEDARTDVSTKIWSLFCVRVRITFLFWSRCHADSFRSGWIAAESSLHPILHHGIL
jgi:hypothetical protein